MESKTILLIGSGYMAIEYAKVLQALEKDFIVIGRSEKSATNFFNKTGKVVIKGGLKNWLKDKDTVDSFIAIVASSVIQLKDCTVQLLEKGCKKILLEKPGALTIKELKEIESTRKLTDAKVYIAYNRRFYASVLEAKKIIMEDGGTLSFLFEFTEWSHKIEPLPLVKELKENWLYANSTHVIDMAFYLGGKPKEFSSYATGGLSWHTRGSIFTGSGKTEAGALFSYISNWESPGRWKIEIMTKNNRLLFAPLEKLQIQKHGSVTFTEVDLKENYDEEYKPGLYLQTLSFLENKNLENFVTLPEQVYNWNYIYNKILQEKSE